MHPKAIESLVALLTRAAQGLVCPVGPDTGKPISESIERFGGFMQNIESVEAERSLLEQLLGKHRWGSRISERYLRDRFKTIYFEVEERRNTEHVRGEVEKLVAEVESISDRRIVLVPLTGIKIESAADIELGNIVLRSMTGERAEEVLEFHRNLTLRNPHFPEEVKQQRFDSFKRRYLENVTGRVCAVYHVVAERTRAEELAVEETRRAIDLLRFAILNLGRPGWKYVVGIQGDVSSDSLTLVNSKEDGTAADYRESIVHYQFEINEKQLEKMREIGVFDLSDLLRKDCPTDFEWLILRGVHWLASAQSQPENENALLNLVTCLETFLKPGKGDPISATIAEGVAILTATGLDERRNRKRRIKAFYDKRSHLTHEGEGEILDSDVQELTTIARDLTMQMLKRREEFPSQKALRNWIDDEKLR